MRVTGRAMVVASSVWICAGCGADPPNPPAPLCTLADPVCHGVRLVGCDPRANQCPTGTACEARSGSGARFVAALSDPQVNCAESTDFDHRCVVPEPTDAWRAAHARSLIEGFQVPSRVQLTRTSTAGGSPATFAISPVEDARIVACAIFSCPPLVVDGRILNYDGCTIARWELEPPPTELDLTAVPALPEPTEDDADCRATHGSTISTLLLGCWAYDDSRIIAASALEPLNPVDFEGGLTKVWSACAAGTTEGDACRLPTGGFGTCAGNDCRRRCLIADDCADASAPDAGAPPGVTCEYRDNLSYVGTCRSGEPAS